MKINKFKKIVDEYKDDITNLYIYYILVNILYCMNFALMI